MNDASQVRHPWRATVRTFSAYVLAALVALNAALPVIEESMGGMLSDEARRILSVIVVTIGALTACITRVIALPQVNAFLAVIGLDADPTGGYDDGVPTTDTESPNGRR